MTFRRTGLTLTIVALAASLLFFVVFLAEGLKDRAGCGSAFFPSDSTQADAGPNAYMPCDAVLIYNANPLYFYSIATVAFAVLAGVIWMWRQQVLERTTAQATAQPTPAAPEAEPAAPVAEPIDAPATHEQFQRPTT